MARTMRLSERDASHVAEWFLALRATNHDLDDCPLCERLAERLARCIGQREVVRIARLVKRHPYTPAKHRHTKKGI